MFTVWKDGDSLDENGSKRKWGEWMRDKDTDPNSGASRVVILPRDHHESRGNDATFSAEMKTRNNFSVSLAVDDTIRQTPEMFHKGTPFSGRSTIQANPGTAGSVTRPGSRNPGSRISTSRINPGAMNTGQGDNYEAEDVSGKSDQGVAAGVIPFELLPHEANCTFKVCV
jgi:hypothetical protein